MTSLYLTTNQLWINESTKILLSKQISVQKLSKLFTHIYFSWDQIYYQYKLLYKWQIQELPLFIIKPINDLEICKILRLIKKYKLLLRIISGKHSSNIYKPQIYVDMTGYDCIQITKNSLIVQGGVTQGKIYEFLFDNKYNYVFPGGSAGSVGVTGLSTSGGLGTLKRTFGLASDNVLSYTIITPAYGKITVYPDDDLFWALSGGVASNFGFVTQLEYKLTPINQVIHYHVYWKLPSIDQSINIITIWLSHSNSLNYKFNETLSFYSNTDLFLEISGIYVGSDYHIVKDHLTYLTNLNPTEFGIEIMTYQQSMQKLGTARIYQPFSVSKTLFKQQINQVDTIVEFIYQTLVFPGIKIFGIELLGGKILEKSNTSFYPRNYNYFIDIFTYCDDIITLRLMENWSDELFKLLYIPPDIVYVGFPIPLLPDHGRAYYGDNYPRLVQIKLKYDPHNLLAYPQGIVPPSQIPPSVISTYTHHHL